ncbi:MAG TPA: GDP-mannose 4,6-dehydratase [Chlamydiales bacterium]|nr:GDP-mannose 4,6-dehydratase [Chlamydiales bacterium]
MKRILITGGAGFIGANFVRRLLKENIELHLLVRPETSLWRIQPFLSHLFLHRVDLECYDLLAGIIKEISPSVIFHFGAHGTSSAHQDAFRIVTSNILGTFHLLKATQEIDYEFFAHIGGSSEYGKLEKEMNERDCIQPNTLYGATKACATLLSQQFALMYQKPLAILRLFSVYGPFESPLRLIPTAINAAFEGDLLQLTPPGFYRDLIFVEDAIDACLQCWQKRITREIINIGTGVQTSNEQVIACIEKLTGKKIALSPISYTPRLSDKQVWVADTRKARDKLAWSPQHSLEEGLQKTIHWYRHDID